jgi:hypothetical protein
MSSVKVSLTGKRKEHACLALWPTVLFSPGSSRLNSKKSSTLQQGLLTTTSATPDVPLTRVSECEKKKNFYFTSFFKWIFYVSAKASYKRILIKR